ncbi:MAG: acetyltransferase [Salinibacter sp.]
MPDRSPLVIVGAGGLGREVAALVEALNGGTPTWDLIGFVDDADALQDTSVMNYPVHGRVDTLAKRSALSYVLAIGDGQSRRDVAGRLDDAPAQPTTLVHPSVSIHRTTTLGEGAILRNGAAPTVDVTIGPHAVVDQHCTVGHDCVLDPFATLHPGVRVSGSVHLGQGATIGAGAVILPDTTIGAHATVGAGAVVTEDLPAGRTAVGVPARPVS